MKRILFILLMFVSVESFACTGITLKTESGETVLARTIEWGGSKLNSSLIISPAGKSYSAMTPVGNGYTFKSKYSYVGISIEQSAFVVEGLNTEGLSAGLFYFPGYGEYKSVDKSLIDKTLSDMQVVSWALSVCADVDEVKREIQKLRVVGIDPRASTVHWRFADRNGRQIVLEIINGEYRFYENKIGVLTNSPDFEWHLKNLNNYVNLQSGTTSNKAPVNLGLRPFGAGSGMLGLPGDVTPPSRFVRAAFYQSTAPVMKKSYDNVIQAFHILNNFDIPIGVEHEAGKSPEGMVSATQWTSVTDISALKFYYRTADNSKIRCISLKDINLKKYSERKLDHIEEQIEELKF